MALKVSNLRAMKSTHMKILKTCISLPIPSITNLLNKNNMKMFLQPNFYRSRARRHDMVVEKGLWVQRQNSARSAPASCHPIILFQPTVMANSALLHFMRDSVRLELTNHFGPTLKGRIFFTWRFSDIKISKPPYRDR